MIMKNSMNTTEVNITKNELLTLLMSVDKPTFTNILYKIKVKMNKTDNPYYERVFKTTKGNFFIGGTYEDMVNERMKKEGLTPNFVSEENNVGEHITKCVQFNEKYNKHYLQYFSFENSIHSTEYEFEGRNIDREMFKSFEVKKSETSRQPQDNKHQVQSLTIDNIKKITLNGTKYNVIEG
jgi:hypothetical protein